MRPIKYTSAGVLLALTGLVVSTSALAGAFGIVPYVEVGVQHDSNVFRVENDADAQTVIGDSPRDDTIGRGAIGVAAEWPISRQRLVLAGEFSEFRYNRFDQLDHSENEVRAALEFAVGPAVNGTLSYERERRQDSFDNLDSAQSNFETENNPKIEVFVEVTPSWRVRTQAGHLRLDQSLDTQQQFNFRENRLVVEVQHLGVPGSIFGVGLEGVDGEYPDRPEGGILSREFTQGTAFVSADWRYSGISTFRGRVGYTRRNNSGGGDRDFDGITGELGYRRQLTGKTIATLQVFRQIFSVDNIDANFLRETGAQAELFWTYSPNLGMDARYRYSDQQFETLSGFSGARNDKLSTLTAELLFQPFRIVTFIFDVTYESRDSNVAGQSFDALRGGLALRLSLDTE